jgi:hypothetical protein
VVVMEQVTRGSRCDKGKGGLLPASMAVGALQKGAWVAVVCYKGGMGGGSALQRGRGVVVVRMEAGTRVRGTGEWWGQ